jgi:hypothetical protein
VTGLTARPQRSERTGFDRRLIAPMILGAILNPTTAETLDLPEQTRP